MNKQTALFIILISNILFNHVYLLNINKRDDEVNQDESKVWYDNEPDSIDSEDFNYRWKKTADLDHLLDDFHFKCIKWGCKSQLKICKKYCNKIKN
jgi:hypothetical protein